MKNIKILLSVSAIILILVFAKKEHPIVADGAGLVQVSGEYSFTEGPAADAQGNVYFTDQPNNQILKWSVDGTFSVFMDSCGRSNGLYFDNNGKLLACADENNQIWSIDTQTKEVKVLVENYDGMKLNGPNDLWVDQKGGIYFTDPYYKRPWWADPTREIEKENLYYRLPDGESVEMVDDNFVRPNGIIGTPDDKTLYVADIGDSKTYSFTIRDDGSLSNRQLFCEMGSDGMTIDYKGNVYLTGKGVVVFNSRGEQIKHIGIDEEWTANVTFGGSDFKTLFITAMNSVYTLEMNVKGVRY